MRRVLHLPQAGSGLHAKIVMPVTAPIVKQEATKGYGAEVELHGESFNEALDYAVRKKTIHSSMPLTMKK